LKYLENAHLIDRERYGSEFKEDYIVRTGVGLNFFMILSLEPLGISDFEFTDSAVNSFT
jgi:hypothetical protein